LYLVRAKTETIKDLGGHREQGVLVITEVYLGPPGMKGEKFECTATGANVHIGGPYEPQGAYVGFFEEGVEGLWWVYYDVTSCTYRPELRWKVLGELEIAHLFPIQKHRMQWADLSGRPVDVEARFKEALDSWARPAEALAQAKSDNDRLALLKRLAADPKAPAAPWAATLLDRAGTAESLAALRELANDEKVAVKTQFVLDKALSRRDGPNWRQSERREQMLRNWLDEARFCGFVPLERWDLDYATYIALVEPCFAKFDKYNAWQRTILAQLLEIRVKPQRSEDQAALFSFLIRVFQKADTLQKADAINVQRAASHGLQCCQPLTDEQARVVRKLRDAARDPVVVRNLDFLLR
jgi:hypothetical protein